MKLRIAGKIYCPGDKSIAHRAVIIAALSKGNTRIDNFPANQDCLSTINALRKLGIRIKEKKFKGFKDRLTVTVFGKGLWGLSKPKGPIFLGESGTTYRLLLGVLAGQDFKTKLSAGKSLSLRPMRRVTAPLRLMGAKISSKFKVQSSKSEEYPPITIKGGNLKAITYKVPVASAQVKSALLLAGLYAKNKTRIIEPVSTRDHTERMLKLFGAGIKVKANNIIIGGGKQLVSPGSVYIPGDISSAGFFIVLACIMPEAKIIIKDISLNPGRIGIIKVLKRMGANIELLTPNSRLPTFEPMGNLIVKSSKLKGTLVKRAEIPSLIDELPILMVAASLARGRTVFEGAGELRVKETDRIRSMSENLKKLGANISTEKKGGIERIIIQGVNRLKGAKVKSFGDHRTAMSMLVAGAVAEGKVKIDDISCIDKSFPSFLGTLSRLVQGASPD